MRPAAPLPDVIGSRGELIAQLGLTTYTADGSGSVRPLFRPCFLGDKWPAIDLYVELVGVPGLRPFFFAQCRTTKRHHLPERGLRIACKKADVAELMQFPAPTYVLGVHEPTKRVFARAVLTGVAARAIGRIPLSHELNGPNRLALWTEVLAHWQARPGRPTLSVFS